MEQTQVNRNLPRFKIGRQLSVPYLTDTAHFKFGDRVGQVKHVEVPETPEEDDVLSYQVEGELVEYVVQDGDSQADAAEALADAHNGNILARGIYTAEAEADKVVLTANARYQEYSVEAVEGVTITEDTAFSDGGTFPVAQAVWIDPDDGVPVKEKPAGDAEELLAGISVFTYDEEQDLPPSEADQEFRADDQLLILRRGVAGVATGDEAKQNQTVYVGVDGDDEGKFFTEDGSDREELSRKLAQWEGPNMLMLKLV